MYIVGIKADSVRTEAEGPEFTLGQLGANHTSDGPKVYMYVKANGAITGLGYICAIDSAYDAAMLTTTNGAAGTLGGSRLGVPQAAIADNGYGWVQVYGKGTVRGAASCVKNTLLYTTATDGVLDDVATAGFVRGVNLTETLTGAAAADCELNWPVVTSA